MSGFKLVLIKELKSLIRDPKLLIAMLIVPLIITGAMYFMIVSFTEQAVKEAEKPGGLVIIVDEDKGFWAKNFTSFLTQRRYSIVYADSVGDALKLYDNLNPVGVVVIPPGFSQNITEGKIGYLGVVLKLRSISLTSISSSNKIFNIIRKYSINISATILAREGINPAYALSPITSIANVYIRGRLIQATNINDVMGTLLMINIFIPIIVLFLAGIIAQLSATSIAVEKEEKMLETLLSLPMNRLSFIAAKITASAIAGLLGAFVYGGLMIWYFSSLTSVEGGSRGTNQLGYIIDIMSNIYGLENITLLILGLIAIVLFVLGLGVLLALFVEDVRSAQIASSYIILPLFFVMFIGLFLDISGYTQLSRMLLALIPIVNIGLIPSYIYIGDQTSIYIAIISSFIYAFLIMYIDSRLVNTEKIFTIKLFRKRR
ncbi:ABC transporter permease [Staphylothermus hellenicus]|uniref:ABC-type Na+ efflux pump permease component-like protein n=1 Tax=Staphylothermus hellenicus (strain DSM 12710 / JCM 10830 / BK20S6-10-b1 / P8) TaxID=591019 RepID=D7DC77_STAHD|nr:ABC transporter permease [Staphylothermus hellenicus]ADI31774.1 ABC-type Na+ efflux pump permease component-like protein [Staphylothermus hellenicus DSM 12710]